MNCEVLDTAAPSLHSTLCWVGRSGKSISNICCCRLLHRDTNKNTDVIFPSYISFPPQDKDFWLIDSLIDILSPSLQHRQPMRGHNYKKPVVTSNMRLYFWREAYRERRSKITEAFFSSARQLTAGATQMFSHQPSLQQLLAAATGLQIWSHISLQTAGRV